MDFVDVLLVRIFKEVEVGIFDIMVGVVDVIFKKIEFVLECWVGVIVYFGDVGLGYKMKLINNFIVMGYVFFYFEVFVVVWKFGLIVEQVNLVIVLGWFVNGFYEIFMKWMLEYDENVYWFFIINVYKDMCYLVNLVISVGVVIFL